MVMINTTQLLNRVKKRGSLSSNAADFSDADILAMATDNLNGLAGEIVGKKQEHLFHTESIPIVAGQSAYRIPDRSIGQVIYDIQWYDNSNADKKKMEKGNPIDRDNRPSSAASLPTGIFFQGNKFHTIPALNNQASGYFQITYAFMPNDLVEATYCATVLAKTATTIQLNKIPTGLEVGSKVDVISQHTGHEPIEYSLVIQAINTGTNTLTFAAVSTLVEVGDFLSAERTACVPMIPEVAHPLLVEMTIRSIARARKLEDAIEDCDKAIAEIRAQIPYLLDERLDTEPSTIRVEPLYDWE